MKILKRKVKESKREGFISLETYSYDAKGRKTRVVTRDVWGSVTTEEFEYNEFGKLKRVIRRNAFGTAYFIQTYRYGKDQAMTSFVVRNLDSNVYTKHCIRTYKKTGVQINQVKDRQGRVTQTIIFDPMQHAHISKNAQGEILSIEFNKFNRNQKLVQQIRLNGQGIIKATVEVRYQKNKEIYINKDAAGHLTHLSVYYYDSERNIVKHVKKDASKKIIRSEVYTLEYYDD